MKDLIVFDGIDGDDRNTPSSSFRYVFNHGESGHVPCKPTDPNVIVTLRHKNPRTTSVSISIHFIQHLHYLIEIQKRNSLFNSQKAYDDYEYQVELSKADSKWLVEPERGLTLKNASLDDVGDYECQGSVKGASTRKYFRIVVSGKNLTFL